MESTVTLNQTRGENPCKTRWVWLCLTILLSVIGVRFNAGRYGSGLLAITAWVGAELAIRRGVNPLAGPWARKGTARAEALRILWPLWRLGFAANVAVMFYVASCLDGRAWLMTATATPWIIFTTLGVLSAALHNLAGSPEALRHYMERIRHIMYLIIGFGPFGMCCIMGTIAVGFIRVWSGGNQLLIQKRSRAMCQFIFQRILRYLEFIGFIKIRYSDRSDKLTTPRLIVGNHISIFDIISTLAFIDQCGTFVKANYARMPIMRQIISACGFIPIDPESHESRQLGMRRAREALLRGETLVVWPEGTRSKDGSLGVFHNGVFRLALEVKADITPMVFTSSGPVFNNLGKLRATQGLTHFDAALEPVIPLDHGARVTPGRVLRARDTVRDFFVQRLSGQDVPEWMRLRPDATQIMEGQ